MESKLSELMDIATSPSLTYQQKLFNMANTAERLISPIDSMGFTQEEMDFINNQMICDLNEGHLPYRPRYIVPDYKVFIEKGSEFLNIKPPGDLEECIDGLTILYHHIPSITSFPVFIGHLDQLLEPFIRDEEKDYKRIKRFLNHIDKIIPDSFCHGDIGPYDTRAGRLILRAITELENPTPNMSIKYNKAITSDDFAHEAIKTCLRVSKPSFANDAMYKEEHGAYALVSCYNALPLGGGAYTLPRLRLGTMAKKVKSVHEFTHDLLPKIARLMLSIMDKRIRFIIEESNFFETSFLVKEGLIHKDNFTAMFGIVGLADAINYLLQVEGLKETFGKSVRGDDIGHEIMKTLEDIVSDHQALGCSRTDHKYLLHAQVGASLHEEDKDNTPAHRIRVGEEPSLLEQLIQSAPFHKYFPSGTGDLYAFDRSYLDHPDALLDIIQGAFASGYRYITTYLDDTDLIRVTGYLVKKSEVEKARENNPVLRDTTWFGLGTDDNAHVFNRRKRNEDDIK